MATDATTPVLPPPAGQTSNFVNPEYRGQTFVVTSCVFLAVAVCSLILRVWTRVFIVRSIWIDDYLMIVALVLSCVLIGVTLDMTNWGLGEHMWDVPMDHFSPNFEQRNLAAAAIYCAATGFTKCSVLVFYTRIFPSRNFHRLVWALVTIAAGYSFASVLANVFSCNPIAMSWDSRITKGTCMNRPVFYFANAGLGIFTDFATVMAVVAPAADAAATEDRRGNYLNDGLFGRHRELYPSLLLGPVDEQRGLDMYDLSNPPQRLELTCLGIGNTTNALMWCNIELNLGITGGCVTALRPFVRRFPKNPRLLQGGPLPDRSPRNLDIRLDLFLAATNETIRSLNPKSSTHLQPAGEMITAARTTFYPRPCSGQGTSGYYPDP
ncbi:hypothetical protein N7468_001346 [Penicillium chermesinum]|uniref:Rhodopsin domain-containing protein n=1 Tax=Penicillium chermesinum TaxID=63820 RepID=A0A9W9PGF5_9EURO|nr:uncharacterized protein N7468_001346 [Penicillium chermesinum]KAJ5246363.1 hypothetical protein N7468_001346 [Penicillium chermesinum]